MKTITLTFDEASNCYNALVNYTNDMKSYASRLAQEGREDEARKVRSACVHDQMKTLRKLKDYLHEELPCLF